MLDLKKIVLQGQQQDGPFFVEYFDFSPCWNSSLSLEKTKDVSNQKSDSLCLSVCVKSGGRRVIIVFSEKYDFYHRLGTHEEQSKDFHIYDLSSTLLTREKIKKMRFLGNEGYLAILSDSKRLFFLDLDRRKSAKASESERNPLILVDDLDSKIEQSSIFSQELNRNFTKTHLGLEPMIQDNFYTAQIQDVEDIAVAIDTQQLLVKFKSQKTRSQSDEVTSDVKLFTFGKPKLQFKGLYCLDLLPESFFQIPACLPLSDSALPFLPKILNYKFMDSEFLQKRKIECVSNLYLHPSLQQTNLAHLDEIAEMQKTLLEKNKETSLFLPLHLA
jgi:hypothetical protein